MTYFQRCAAALLAAVTVKSAVAADTFTLTTSGTNQEVVETLPSIDINQPLGFVLRSATEGPAVVLYELVGLNSTNIIDTVVGFGALETTSATPELYATAGFNNVTGLQENQIVFDIGQTLPTEDTVGLLFLNGSLNRNPTTGQAAIINLYSQVGSTISAADADGNLIGTPLLNTTFTPTPTVPEPSTVWLALTGAGGAFFAARRQAAKQQHKLG